MHALIAQMVRALHISLQCSNGAMRRVAVTGMFVGCMASFLLN